MFEDKRFRNLFSYDHQYCVSRTTALSGISPSFCACVLHQEWPDLLRSVFWDVDPIFVSYWILREPLIFKFFRLSYKGLRFGLKPICVLLGIFRVFMLLAFRGLWAWGSGLGFWLFSGFHLLACSDICKATYSFPYWAKCGCAQWWGLNRQQVSVIGSGNGTNFRAGSGTFALSRAQFCFLGLG